MGEQRGEFYWHKLDNAAKVFPAVHGAHNSGVFRVTAKLTEEVDPELLQKALVSAMAELPTFNVKMRKGLFWYYWENNFLKPVVMQDNGYPLRKLEKRKDNGFSFRVTYFGKKINLEMFHGLTDGAGAIVLLKNVIYFYLKQRYPGEITVNELITETGFSQHALDEDSFLRMRSGVGKVKAPKTVAAYQMEGTRYFGERVDVTTGIMPVKDVIKLAKAANVTVTVYVTGLLMYSIYQNNYKYHAENKPIVLSVPINLRGFFESSTIRNFFSFVTVSLNFYQNDFTFEQVLEQLAVQFKDALQLENITKRIDYNVKAERNLAIRVIPLFLKNILMRFIHGSREKGFTSTISNLGQIKLPAEQMPYVERFEALNNITKRQCFKACLCSLNDTMTVSFISGMGDKDVERYFFRFLARQGLDVQLSYNGVDEE